MEQLQLTLVAYYDQKPAALSNAYSALQRICLQLGNTYTPYTLDQLHATLIGLEAQHSSHTWLNTNFQSLRNEARPMQLPAALDTVRRWIATPLDLRLGGFNPADHYPFTSRGQHPYLRSFSLQPDRVVAMAWPCSREGYPPRLAQLRRDLEPHGILHKYHPQPKDADNDLFFVLGRLRATPDPDLAHKVESEARELLRAAPLTLQLTLSDLSVVQYEDPGLPRATSVSRPLASFDGRELRPGAL